MEHKTNKLDNDLKYKFTICTPCYNSSNTIKRVYESLENLNFRDFEWIVINDASSDNTSSLILEILSKASFDIDFYNLEQNRMVTYCYNLAVKKSRGEMFLLLDHDDYIIPEALDRFIFHWNKLNSKDKLNSAGLISNCMDENKQLVGTPFPASPMLEGFFEMIFFHKVRGEKFFCYRTEIMKRFNFPLEDRYVPESTVMHNISESFKTLFFNESLRVYVKPKYENNNLSFMNKFEYSQGFRFNYLELINRHKNKVVSKPYIFFAFIFNYVIFSIDSDLSFRRTLKDIRGFLFRIPIIFFYPFMKCYWVFLRGLLNKTS